eukprot:scaffold442_cov268-Pinguiococcus_pyrenoidosus.AAC.42
MPAAQAFSAKVHAASAGSLPFSAVHLASASTPYWLSTFRTGSRAVATVILPRLSTLNRSFFRRPEGSRTTGGSGIGDRVSEKSASASSSMKSADSTLMSSFTTTARESCLVNSALYRDGGSWRMLADPRFAVRGTLWTLLRSSPVVVAPVDRRRLPKGSRYSTLGIKVKMSETAERFGRGFLNSFGSGMGGASATLPVIRA